MSILVGKSAPDFSSAAVLPSGEITNTFSLSEVIANKYAVIFFYPLDFTFVCPSELLALESRTKKFAELQTEIIAISVDSAFTHHAWRNTPINKGGIGPVHYPLVADVSHQICQAYGVEHEKASVALRAAFIINKKGIVCAQIVNDLPLGRNIDELIRLIDALQFHEVHGEVCPAGWRRGDPGMKPTLEGVATYLSENAESL